jgi:hypothetical protein
MASGDRCSDRPDSRFSDLFRGEEVADREHLDPGKVQMFLSIVVLVLGPGLAVGDRR